MEELRRNLTDLVKHLFFSTVEAFLHFDEWEMSS